MDQWLDSLSEDWVSQPRSPQSNSSIQGSILRDSPSSDSNPSQSRIPRYKPRSASGLSSASVKEPGKSRSSQKDGQVDSALREKTSSNINALRKVNGQVKPHNPNAASTRLRDSQASMGSKSEVVEGTVQFKQAPGKKRNSEGTPEWKRRVLKENAGGDLFGPIGLESVFKPPTVKAKGQPKAAGKRKTPARKEILSSPPPYSPAKQESGSLANGLPGTATAISSGTNSLIEPHKPQGFIKEISAHISPNSIQKAEHQSTIDPRISRALGGSPRSITSVSPRSPIADTKHPSLSETRSRIISGESKYSGVFSDQSRNEDISPFYVSRHNTVDGRVEYAAVDSSMRRLRSQMDKVRLQQQIIPTSRSSDDGVDYAQSRPSELSVLQERMDEVTSQSLPDDLSMGTDAYAANGGFVSVRRGGYSNDGSFQRRPVSPSLLADLDGPSLRLPSSGDNGQIVSPELPVNFSQTKSRTPSSPPPSSLPRTPKNQNHERSSSDDRPRSSGSPLKLFDKYDTFTNERLIRRMSKFEETVHDDPQENNNGNGSDAVPPSPSPRRRRIYKQHQTDSIIEASTGRRISSFGDGHLDGYQFPPYRETSTAKESDQDAAKQSRSFRFKRSASFPSGESSRRKISDDQKRIHPDLSKPSQDNALPRHNSTLVEYQKIEDQQAIQTVTGKRLPYSPAKDPAPKRRRTLLVSQTSRPDLGGHNKTFEVPIRSISGRKRKDARYENDRQTADPSTLAMRHIRQPKALNANQTGYTTKSSDTLLVSHGENEPFSNSCQPGDKEYPSLDPPTQIVAGALATIALNTAQEVTAGSRKASVTTADFFNEAQHIMQLIRAKGRPRSSHVNSEGSDLGQPTIVEESFTGESTKDEFSRPPSREGTSHRLQEPARIDARVVSHLRKFEDDQDLGLALSSSLKTLKIDQSRRQSEASGSRGEKGNDTQSDTESDPPNIRIRESIVHNHKRKYSSSTYDFPVPGSGTQNRSKSPDATSGPSSGRSVPTGSSHSSTNRMIIAPETVAHLLSDQMAGMIFDRQRQLWVKRKSSPNIEISGNQEHTMSEKTEEDLFGDIPDLSVDEMEELQRVKEAVSSVESIGSGTHKISIHDHAMLNKPKGEMLGHAEQVENLRPKTAEDKSIPTIDNSSAPSKFSHFASSGLQPGTRATSWGDDAFPTKEPQLPKVHTLTASTDAEHGHEEQVEHEISIFEGRESQIPKYASHRQNQARVVTVAFSSPLVEHQEPVFGQVEDSDFEDGESESSLSDSPVRYGIRQGTFTKKRTPSKSVRKIGRRNASVRMSGSNQSCLVQPMSRLDEEDEMSLIHCPIGNRQMSMEVAITTPLPVSRSLMVPPSTNGRSSVGLHLSPLPDFTVHQIDKPVDGHRGQVATRSSTREVSNPLSLAAQDLIKKLTDIEPYEPYWDYIRSVNLRARGLETLHMLDHFCGRIEELDVSGNQIRELNGVPATVRQLSIRDNCLSDLAAWDALRNLQYLDVSNNGISSLQGFQNLYHLRSLRADGNEIDSINGLEDLNGLTSLSLRGNRLRVVDFEVFDL